MLEGWQPLPLPLLVVAIPTVASTVLSHRLKSEEERGGGLNGEAGEAFVELQALIKKQEEPLKNVASSSGFFK